MKRIVIVGVSLSLSLSAAATSVTPPSPIETWMKEHANEIAAATVAEIHADRVDTRAFGRRAGADSAAPDADTQFQLGSITKVFTNLLLAELKADGKVGYAQTLGDLLPKTFEPRNAAVARITLHSLATHSSGLPRLPANLDLSNQVDPYGDYDVGDLIDGLNGTRDKQPLGRFYTYSNFGAGVLGHVLGRADGSDYATALTRRVIAPLELRHTGFAPGGNAATPVSGGKPVSPWRFQDAFAGAGALWGSVSDLARLVQTCLGRHTHRFQHELSDDFEIAVPDAGAFAVTRVWHVAHVGKQPIYWHNGGTSGFHSFVGFRPDQSRGVAILLSGDADPTDIGLQALGFDKPAPATAKVADRSVLGQYQLTDKFGIGVYEQRGRLLAQATGQPAFVLHPVSEDWYAYGEVDASVHFVRNEGAVTGLELAQNGVVQSASRVADVATAAARQEIPLDAKTLDDYIGRYAFAPGVDLTLKRAGEGLEAQLSGQPFFAIYPRAKDRFFYKVVDAELAFERDASGRVQAVVLHQGGVEQRALRKP